MTTAATFTTLQPPAQEDSMDMSSPALYDDIEIDFDEQPGGVDLHLADPDRMTDDGEHTRPGTATDLMMEDDPSLHELHVPEQDMQDGFDPVQYEAQLGDGDDDLIDYDDELYDDAILVEDQPAETLAQPVTHAEQPGDVAANVEAEQVDEEVPRQPEEFATQQPAVALEDTVFEEVLAPAVTEPELEAPDSTAMPPVDDAATAVDSANATEAAVPANAAADDQTDALGDVQDHVAETEDPDGAVDAAVDGARIPASLNTSLSFPNDSPGTPTDTGLHPMTICYGENTLPLFKSKNSLDGLLKNDNLVNVSLAELLNNCRQRICIKLHEDVSEDMDLILLFDGLNLSVTESDHQCSVITLNEVLDVYTQLHANEGVHDIPPFCLTLYTQSKFSSTFNILKQGANAGHGISAYIDNTANENQDEDFTGEYQDHTGEDAPLDCEDVAHEEYTNNEQSVLDQNATEGQEYEYQDLEDTTAYEDAADGEGDRDDNEHEEVRPVAADSEVHDGLTRSHEEDSAEPEHEDAAHESEVENQQAVPHDEAHNVAAGRFDVGPNRVAHAEQEEDPHGLPAEHEEEDGRVESGASSTTLRAEHAEDAVGKYSDEDRLDFDDDLYVLTSDSEPGFDGQDDYSTFLTELGEDETAAAHADTKLDVTDDVLETIAATEDEQNANGAAKASEPADETPAHATENEAAGEDGPNLYQDDETLGFEGDATEYFDPTEDNVFDEQQDYENSQADFHTGQDYSEGADHDGLDLGAADVETAKAIDAHQQAPVDDPEDRIDFDDDTEEQHEARKASAATVKVGSPSGKRTFDATESLYDDEEPELKKARSS